jgi:hypothetical protein
MLALIVIAVIVAANQPATPCNAWIYPTDPVSITVNGEAYIVPDGIKTSLTCKN